MTEREAEGDGVGEKEQLSREGEIDAVREEKERLEPWTVFNPESEPSRETQTG